jgi:hypothetical protein
MFKIFIIEKHLHSLENNLKYFLFYKIYQRIIYS